MTTLHVQTRAYPLDHAGLEPLPEPVTLTDGTVVAAGRLGSLAYREQGTYDIVEPPGFEAVNPGADTHVAWRRIRVLPTGAMLVSTAFRHDRDLRDLDVMALSHLDARVDRTVRADEATAVARLRRNLVEAGLLRGGASSAADTGAGGIAVLLEDPVRYNCHLVDAAPPAGWTPTRILTPADDLAALDCRLLLPYTFCWEVPADVTPDELLTLLEPADLVVAQRVLLGAANGRAVRLLDRLATDRTDPAPIEGFRAEVDRIRAIYHRMESYRYDSAQDARGVHLAARREVDLDRIHARTETLLDQVADSLNAANQARSLKFERRLNTIVGVLTIVTAGTFVLDVVVFATGGRNVATPARVATIAAILLTSLVLVAWVWLTRRRRT